jgi:hypothetical protein
MEYIWTSIGLATFGTLMGVMVGFVEHVLRG